MKYNDGSYKGSGIGYGGEIEALVTITEGKIQKIEFTSHNETPVISDPAFNNVPAKIVAENTILVPNVKGCSMSSRGIREAVKNALIESGADAHRLEDEILEAEKLEKIVVNTRVIKDIEKFDVAIVGGGGAGLSAAITAAKGGAKVVLLEKMAAVLGSTPKQDSADFTTSVKGTAAGSTDHSLDGVPSKSLSFNWFRSQGTPSPSCPAMVSRMAQ